MLNKTKVVEVVCVAFLGLTPAAHAQQDSSMSNMSGMSDSKMQGMGGAQGNSRGDMNMQTMMKHCAQMKEDMKQGKPMGAGMQKMMSKCDQMESGMKTDTQAPAATEGR